MLNAPKLTTEALAESECNNQARLKKEYDGKAGTKFFTEVRESMLFQYNWADLLSATPTVLSLGACHVDSSSSGHQFGFRHA